MNVNRRNAVMLAAMLALTLAQASPGVTFLDSFGGKTIDEYTFDWWNWTNSLPQSQVPFQDTTGRAPTSTTMVPSSFSREPAEPRRRAGSICLRTAPFSCH